MVLPLIRVLAAAAALACVVDAAPQSADLRTRAETSDFAETSRYDDVMRVVRGLAAASALARVETFGSSEEGRELPLLVLASPAVASPEAARALARPIVLIQANIHGGEVEGKEAALLLARRLTTGDLQPLLRDLVVLVAPIYNADGNERVSPEQRPAQNGPIGGVGTRENARGLDLNRDYMKLDSAEARALVALLARWDPHVAIDLHTTNGSYHGYHLTYSPTLNPNADPRLIALARERLLPAAQQAVLATHGLPTYFYGNFAAASDLARQIARVDPATAGDVVWRTFDHRPRFGNNYVGLRNRVAILSEAYSYVDFRGRIRVTEVFVEAVLRAVAANAARVTALTAQADRDTFAARAEAGVAFRLAALPEPVPILVGDVEARPNPRSGRERLVRGPTAVPVRMKDYGRFEAARTVRVPAGWLIPKPHAESGRYAAALERLRWHGVRIRTVAADVQVAVERFVVADLTRAERAFQGHHEARLTGRYEAATLSAQPGALFVPAAQPLGRLAFYLLEPESDDGLVAWNLIEEGLSAGATYPIYRVMATGALRFRD